MLVPYVFIRCKYREVLYCLSFRKSKSLVNKLGNVFLMKRVLHVNNSEGKIYIGEETEDHGRVNITPESEVSLFFGGGDFGFF